MRLFLTISLFFAAVTSTAQDRALEDRRGRTETAATSIACDGFSCYKESTDVERNEKTNRSNTVRERVAQILGTDLKQAEEVRKTRNVEGN